MWEEGKLCVMSSDWHHYFVVLLFSVFFLSSDISGSHVLVFYSNAYKYADGGVFSWSISSIYFIIETYTASETSMYVIMISKLLKFML